MSESTRASSRLTSTFNGVLRAAQLLFARSDARARDRGWEVAVTGPYGTGRSYRDPRFDLLRGCPRCAGSGRAPSGADCGRCAGTGRIGSDLGRRSAG